MTRAAVPGLLATALTAVLATLLSGCGAAPTKLGPTGVDGLTVPTPTPDPDDFATGVGNIWFPLAAGTVWTYRRDTPTETATLVAEVLPEPREIAGVATTGVRWELRRHGRGVPVLTRWYADDDAGNVWWFGQVVRRGPVVDDLARRSWTAGQGGAEAGLVVSAQPRTGDGYVNADVPRVLERRSTVESLTASVATSDRTYRDTVLTRDLSSFHPTQVTESFFARGVGLVAQQTSGASTSDLTLVGVHHG